jgi:RHS repeat-associated protein
VNTNLSELYAYDAADRLIDSRGGTLNGGGESDNAVLIYIHNPDWQIIEVRDDTEGGDPAIQRFMHASGNQSQTASAYVDDHVAYDRWNGEGWDRYQYLIDKQYNTVALTNVGSEVVERVITDPYGRARTYDSSCANGAARSRIDNPFMHQGLYFDHEAGGVGYQNRARQYNAVVGRFMQRDLLGYPDGPSSYAYQSASLATLDPLGLETIRDIATDPENKYIFDHMWEQARAKDREVYCHIRYKYVPQKRAKKEPGYYKKIIGVGVSKRSNSDGCWPDETWPGGRRPPTVVGVGHTHQDDSALVGPSDRDMRWHEKQGIPGIILVQDKTTEKDDYKIIVIDEHGRVDDDDKDGKGADADLPEPNGTQGRWIGTDYGSGVIQGDCTMSYCPVSTCSK